MGFELAECSHKIISVAVLKSSEGLILGKTSKFCLLFLICMNILPLTKHWAGQSMRAPSAETSWAHFPSASQILIRYFQTSLTVNFSHVLIF